MQVLYAVQYTLQYTLYVLYEYTSNTYSRVCWHTNLLMNMYERS